MRKVQSKFLIFLVGEFNFDFYILLVDFYTFLVLSAHLYCAFSISKNARVLATIFFQIGNIERKNISDIHSIYFLGLKILNLKIGFSSSKFPVLLTKNIKISAFSAKKQRTFWEDISLSFLKQIGINFSPYFR